MFASTYGASKDIVNEDFRRLLINGCFWAAGLEQSIRADADIALVGPYQPSTYRFGGYRTGIKPADLTGWDAPIMPQVR